MDPTRAREIAERLHKADRQEDGAPLLDHIRRVARSAHGDARAVAWLHEALETTTITERELLRDGLTEDELRALRLLSRDPESRSETAYFGHLEVIAHASGIPGRLARLVKTADLKDRVRHPRVRRDGWSPPYEQALAWMEQATAADRPMVGALHG